MTLTADEIKQIVDSIKDFIAIDSGIVSSNSVAGCNVLQDGNKIWATNIHANRIVSVTLPTGLVQQSVIHNNSANALVLRSN